MSFGEDSITRRIVVSSDLRTQSVIDTTVDMDRIQLSQKELCFGSLRYSVGDAIQFKREFLNPIIKTLKEIKRMVKRGRPIDEQHFMVLNNPRVQSEIILCITEDWNGQKELMIIQRDFRPELDDPIPHEPIVIKLYSYNKLLDSLIWAKEQ